MESQEMQWLLKEKYNGEKSAAFFADCKRLALGEPLAYLIGWSPFLDCKIWLDEHPLIPRPETEHWTEEAINVIRGGATLPLGFETKTPYILDLCAGSGCIGVAVAKAIPEARVDFGEIDARLLPTIKKNLSENQIPESHTNIVHTNLFSKLPGEYDFILSNPPYINETTNQTEEAVKKHEPYVALFGGKDGLEVIEKIISEAPKHLTKGGQLWLEHDPEQSAPLQAFATNHNFQAITHKDQYGVERYSVLVLQ